MTTTKMTLNRIASLKANQSILLKNKYGQLIHYRVDHLKPHHVNDANQRFTFMKNVDDCRRYPDCFSDSDLLEYEVVD